jgi:hypothetical protein
MREISLFTENIYEFEYQDHFKQQRQLVSLIKSGTLNSTDKHRITFSRSNLHNNKEFEPVTEFMQNCVKEAMYAMGYVPNVRVTSMWSTYQKNNEFHHYHTHNNTFLAAVYYLHCKNPKLAKGTVFFNTNYPKYSPIMPNAHKDFPKKIQSLRKFDFVVGNVYVFPACIPHMTAPNEDEERIIIGMNTMPLGLADDDEYDKYKYN